MKEAARGDVTGEGRPGSIVIRGGFAMKASASVLFSLVLCLLIQIPATAAVPGETGRGPSVLSREEMGSITGNFCSVCKTRSTCSRTYGDPCVLLSACSICSPGATGKSCGFTLNPFATCTALAAVGCGTEIIGACVPLTGVCTSTGIPAAGNACTGTVPNCV